MTYAIAKTLDGATYVSPIFAIKFDGGSSAAIGLDASLSCVQKAGFLADGAEGGESLSHLSQKPVHRLQRVRRCPQEVVRYGLADE
jgi:hypothetical protein